jgi:hypothetical protein
MALHIASASELEQRERFGLHWIAGGGNVLSYPMFVESVIQTTDGPLSRSAALRIHGRIAILKHGSDKN